MDKDSVSKLWTWCDCELHEDFECGCEGTHSPIACNNRIIHWSDLHWNMGCAFNYLLCACFQYADILDGVVEKRDELIGTIQNVLLEVVDNGLIEDPELEETFVKLREEMRGEE